MTRIPSQWTVVALVAGAILIEAGDCRAQRGVVQPATPSRGNIGRAVDAPPRTRTPPAETLPSGAGTRVQPQIEGRVRPGRTSWRLGVDVDNRETGVEVTRVFSNTAASRAGLERGDVIVSVGGFQVGFVGRDFYSLGTELNQQADSRGRVRLLVWNRRSRQLTNLDVTLDRAGDGGGIGGGTPPARNTITGTAMFRERIAVPSGARLDVRLIQERQGRSPSRVIASESVPLRGRVPVPFSISFNQRDIVRSASHVLEAEIVSDGRSMFSTPSPVRVLTGPGSENVDLLLTSTR